ncbi:hypothetical protein [Acinetobacter sp. c3-l95]|uniref:hypothetical protein n=1 Tax=Acinetobacter sp. c3-l95 TaxID=3342804 RepID=UPI0035BA528C
MSTHPILMSLLFTASHVCAENKLKIDDNQCLVSQDVQQEDDIYTAKTLILKIGDCHQSSQQYQKIGEFDVPNDTPKLDWVLAKKINNKQYIIAMMSFDADFRDQQRDINYTRYYMPTIYTCTHQQCKSENGRLDHFISAGGDLKNFSTNQFIRKYPYKLKNMLEKDLNTQLFKDWFNQNTIQGVTLKTIPLSAESYPLTDLNINVDKNTAFTVLDINARYLNIIFMDKKGKKIQGWINCEATNLCQSFNK